MELQQIKYFLALAQELHFWNTSEKMFITQSALSRQIKALEEDLGVQLFERSKRNVKLTQAGVFLRDRWLPLLEEINRMHRQARKIHEGAYGSISIGYPGSVAYGFLPEFITGIAQTLPELKVELVEPTDISFEQLLLNYQIDLAFRRDPAENPALQSISLYSEHFALVVPQHHRLQQENFQGLQEVKDEKFILSGLHHQTFYVNSLRQIFNEYGFTPNVYIESDFGGMILSLVARGLGVTVLPSSYSFGAPPDVRFIHLPHKANLYVTWRREDTSPVLTNVLRQVQETAQKFNTEQI
ncbi:LysR family transcriptional regulator [Rufibacter hautae]|uniref:LysR family transcriptional regulator n=1 Tax=Rufibacter hautae TaxID=2595005 RepID=A0A5B6TD17_9BACT|nr:LysR family transcriptional regulator [Rufibacter hautae]KAA3436841.1 LysR family transcriptional regulator [Rufibacter hautae]